MIRRWRSRSSAEKPTSSSSPNPTLAHFAMRGGEVLAVGAGENKKTTPEEQSKSYSDMVLERLNTVSKSQRALLREAVNRGVPESDLSALVADAINNGMLPRVVEGLRMRGGAVVYLLDGPVPAELLNVTARDIPEHVVPGRENPDQGISIPDRTVPACFETSVIYTDWQHKPDEFPGLNVESFRVPTYDTGEPVDYTVLAKIDAHMQPTDMA